MSDASRVMTPDEFQIWTRAELARIDQLHADADRRRQEMEIAPRLLRIEAWKASATLIGTGAAIFGAALALFKYLAT